MPVKINNWALARGGAVLKPVEGTNRVMGLRGVWGAVHRLVGLAVLGERRRELGVREPWRLPSGVSGVSVSRWGCRRQAPPRNSQELAGSVLDAIGSAMGAGGEARAQGRLRVVGLRIFH